jgi:translation initiation factor IF-3
LLIGYDGKQYGIVSRKEALSIAYQEGLDLVEVAPQNDPPTCKLMDYGKFQYQQKKKMQEAKKKQKIMHIKEMVFRPNIDTHDYEIKKRNIVRFLQEGDKVKVVIRFKGREVNYFEAGDKLLSRLVQDISAFGVLESKPQQMEKQITAVLIPKKS